CGMYRTLTDDIIQAGGAAGRAHLRSLGHSDRTLSAAVRARVIARPRRGWYTVWPDSDPRLQALRIGGRLTGLSAIAAMGGWVRTRPRMHVAVPINAARLRCPRRRTVAFTASPRRSSVVLHWSRQRHDRDVSTGVVGLLEALEVAFLTATSEDAVAALDWARRSGRIDVIDLETLRERLPASLRILVARSSDQCHSLPESLTRTRLAALGLRAREQVVIPGDASPIDLLVEHAVAIEVDGDEFHRDRFERDRAKDLAITVHGLHAIRPAARHVYDDWPRVEAAVLTALAERKVPVPALPSRRARPGVNNSGQRARARRLSRAFPRTVSPRPRPRPSLS
ncbi:MAG: hypothetical protein ACXIUP_08065, partial [Microcella sp.]